VAHTFHQFSLFACARFLVRPPSHRPPTYLDVVDYMAAMPAANFSGLPVSVTMPVSNTSGFLMDPSLVVDAKTASLAGLSLLDEYLLSVRVRVLVPLHLRVVSVFSS
jgi:hypothetical protein